MAKAKRFFERLRCKNKTCLHTKIVTLFIFSAAKLKMVLLGKAERCTAVPDPVASKVMGSIIAVSKACFFFKFHCFSSTYWSETWEPSDIKEVILSVSLVGWVEADEGQLKTKQNNTQPKPNHLNSWGQDYSTISLFLLHVIVTSVYPQVNTLEECLHSCFISLFWQLV